MTEGLVEAPDLADRLARPLDREEVLHGRRDMDRARVCEQQEPRMVDTLLHQAGRVLLGIAVGIVEEADGHPHRQGAHEARRKDRADAPVEGADPGRLEPAAARAGNRETLGLHLGPRLEVVHRADPVPDHVTRQARAREDREVAEDGMLPADEVVAAPAARRVPELASLPLAHGVPAEDHVPAADEAHGDLLVGGIGLSQWRVAARHEDGRLRSRRRVGQVQEGRHVKPGKALEDDLLDPVPVTRDRSRDAGIERRALGRKPTDDPEGLLPQLPLERQELRLGAHRVEARAAGVVLPPGEVQLGPEQRRDARPGVRGAQHLQHLGRRPRLVRSGGRTHQQGHRRGRRNDDLHRVSPRRPT